MITKVNHIGILVSSIDEAAKLYTEILGLRVKEIETHEDLKIKVALIPVGESKIELIELTDPASKGQEGLHHIALEVNGIEEALETISNKGVPLRDKKPRPGAENSRIAFLSPEGTRGVLIELVEPSKQ